SVHISNSVVSGNHPGGLRGFDVTVINTEFTNSIDNDAISIPNGRLEVHDSTFTGNPAGAIDMSTAYGPGAYEIHNSSFKDNTSTVGGAINISAGNWDTATLLIAGCEFINNVSNDHPGGAIVANNIGD